MTTSTTGQDQEPSDHDTPQTADSRQSEPSKKKDGSKDADERLDQGLEETFPSSDPVSVKITK